MGLAENVKAKPWLFAGGAAIAVLGVYEYRKQAMSVKATTSAASGIDPMTGVPFSQEIDPNTGLPFSQEAGIGGSPIGSPFGALSGMSLNPLTGQFQPAQSLLPTTPTSNPQWMQAAESYLVGLGFDPTATASALGRYLSGTTLSADQLGIVQAGIGGFGTPPTAVKAPTLTPATGQTPARVADGYYVLYPTHQPFQVANGLRYLITAPTWAALNHNPASRPKATIIIASNPVMKLPSGGRV